VLGYDDKKQMEFLNYLSGKKLTLADLVFWMMAAIVLVMLITSYFLFRQVKAKLNPAQAAYQQYLRKLKRVNCQPNVGEGALDFAARVGKILPEKASLAKAIAEDYNALQYSIHAPSGGIQLLMQKIEQFKL
jgi:uncharacterized membrane-anchored protein YhcB (DUF1043 family)